MKICTVLIPTYKRPDCLVKAIQSLHAHADSANFDIVVRADFDDRQTIDALTGLPDSYTSNLKVVLGRTTKDYNGISSLWMDCADLSESTWCWITTDDMLISGSRWDLELAKLNPDCTLAWSEYHQLGTTEYGSALNLAEVVSGMRNPPEYKTTTTPHFTMPWIPTKSWAPFFGRVIPKDVDTSIEWTMRRDAHWRLEVLRGVRVHHLFLEHLK